MKRKKTEFKKIALLFVSEETRMFLLQLAVVLRYEYISPEGMEWQMG